MWMSEASIQKYVNARNVDGYSHTYGKARFIYLSLLHVLRARLMHKQTMVMTTKMGKE